MTRLTRDETIDVLTRFAQALGVPMEVKQRVNGGTGPVSWHDLADHNHVTMDELFARFQEVARDCGWKLVRWAGNWWEEEHQRLVVDYSEAQRPGAGRFMVRGVGGWSYGPELRPITTEADDALQDA